MFRVMTIAAVVLLAGCGRAPDANPIIEFTRVPDAAEGGPEALATIAGRVTGARSDHRLVLFRRARTRSTSYSLTSGASSRRRRGSDDARRLDRDRAARVGLLSIDSYLFGRREIVIPGEPRR